MEIFKRISLSTFIAKVAEKVLVLYQHFHFSFWWAGGEIGMRNVELYLRNKAVYSGVMG